MLQFQVFLGVIRDVEVAGQTFDHYFLILLSNPRLEPFLSVFDELRLYGVCIAGMSEHVVFQFEGRLPQSNLEQNYA